MLQKEQLIRIQQGFTKQPLLTTNQEAQRSNPVQVFLRPINSQHNGITKTSCHDGNIEN